MLMLHLSLLLSLPLSGSCGLWIWSRWYLGLRIHLWVGSWLALRGSSVTDCVVLHCHLLSSELLLLDLLSPLSLLGLLLCLLSILLILLLLMLLLLLLLVLCCYCLLLLRLLLLLLLYLLVLLVLVLLSL